MLHAATKHIVFICSMEAQNRQRTKIDHFQNSRHAPRVQEQICDRIAHGKVRGSTAERVWGFCKWSIGSGMTHALHEIERRKENKKTFSKKRGKMHYFA